MGRENPAAALMEIEKRTPERVMRDAHGRMFLLSDAVRCRGLTKLKPERVAELMRARGLEPKGNEHERVLDFVGSDETVDRYGDIIRVDGWELEEFRRNPVMPVNHDYVGATHLGGLPVAQTLEVVREKVEGREVLRFSNLFADAETYPLADTIFRLYKGGFLNATSVGFIPLEIEDLTEEQKIALGMKPYGRVYKRQKLLENSAVTMPANPNALQLALQQRAITLPEAFSVAASDPRVDALEELKAELRALVAERRGLIAVEGGWSHRLRDPGLFEDDSFEEVAWEDAEAPHPVSMVVGTLKAEGGGEGEKEEALKAAGKTAVQSVRFKEADGWDEDGAASWVEEKRDALATLEPFKKFFDPLEDYPELRELFAGILEETDEDRELREEAEAVLEEQKKAKKPPFVVQTLILSKSRFKTAEEARKWVTGHDFHAAKVDETEKSWRFRQREPDEFARLRTIKLDDGVMAVGGPLKAKSYEQTMSIHVEVDSESAMQRLEELSDRCSELVAMASSLETLGMIQPAASAAEPQEGAYYEELLGLREELKIKKP